MISMAKSPEYPDLTWVPPKAFGSGRDGKAVRFIVVHYTAGAERNTSAEDGASYDQRRTDGTSTHYFVDSNSVIQCVRTSDRGNAARAKGNRLGIQYELCGTVQTRAQWLDAASLATLKNAARQIARDCRKYGIPVRRLSVAETRAAWSDFPRGPKGIVGHVDCTNAFPEDGGDHTDPGPAFPWDVFLPMIQSELTALSKPTEDDVSEQDVTNALTKFFKVSSQPNGQPESKIGHDASAQGVPDTINGGTTALYRLIGAIGTQVVLTRREVAALAGQDFVDEDAIVAGILAGFPAEKIAAAIPAEVASQVADILAARLSA